jgi:hypothetical protein
MPRQGKQQKAARAEEIFLAGLAAERQRMFRVK